MVGLNGYCKPLCLIHILVQIIHTRHRILTKDISCFASFCIHLEQRVIGNVLIVLDKTNICF